VREGIIDDMTIAEIADKLEIHELLARYTRLWDDHEPEAWADLFTPDGSLRAAGGVTQGREALVELARARSGMSIHTTTNATIELDGDTAHHVATLLVHGHARADEPHDVMLVARYVDELRRTEGGWRIRSREVVAAYPEPR